MGVHIIFTLEKDIKKVMKLQGFTFATLAEELSKRVGKTITPQALNYKLNGGIKLVELMEICDILGYELGVTPKEEGRGSHCL